MKLLPQLTLAYIGCRIFIYLIHTVCYLLPARAFSEIGHEAALQSHSKSPPTAQQQSRVNKNNLRMQSAAIAS